MFGLEDELKEKIEIARKALDKIAKISTDSYAVIIAQRALKDLKEK